MHRDGKEERVHCRNIEFNNKIKMKKKEKELNGWDIQENLK